MESYHIVLLSNILDFVPCDLQLQRPTAAFDIPLAPAAHCLDGRLGGESGEGFFGVYERHGDFFGSREKHGFGGEGGGCTFHPVKLTITSAIYCWCGIWGVC